MIQATHNGEVRRPERAPCERSRFNVELARSGADLLDSTRLRYSVFVEEMGARLPRSPLAIECDRFDRYCDHLLVREVITRRVVGSYRMLTAVRARQAGGFYAESEFDLAGMSRLREGILEIGRACVHPAHRNGIIISLLWSGILKYALATGHDYIIGCASIPLGENPRDAAALCIQLTRDSPCPPELQVYPRRPFRIEGGPRGLAASELPALIKGYLRIGAYACGEPAWDAEFGTADVLMMLPLAEMSPRYRRFLSRLA